LRAGRHDACENGAHPTAHINPTPQESIMMLSRSFTRRAWAPLVIALAVPVALQAQERVLGTWNGRVDKEMQLTIRGNNFSSNTLNGQQLNGRFRMQSALPQQDGEVHVAVSRGRGEVSVVQQPSSANGYTAIVRMLDRNPGADSYRVTVSWTPMYAGRGSRDMNGRGNMGNRGREMGRGNGRMNAASVLRWTGDVDSEVEIRWGPNGVAQRNLGGNGLRNARSSQSGGAVRQGGTVTVSSRTARGTVQIVQQPSAANGWTAVLRVHDPQPGYGHYDFDVNWQ